MKKLLKSTARTKKYLDKLPKIYGIFLWAKWGILELPWTGKLDKDGLPLVYIYYDANGLYDGYRLGSIRSASSGGFYDWYTDREYAEHIKDNLNQEEVSSRFVRRSFKLRPDKPEDWENDPDYPLHTGWHSQ